MISQKTYNESHGREFVHAHRSKINASGHKEHKEAMHCFAKALNTNEWTKKEKSHKIKKLERRFNIESDFAFIIADRIRNGKLKEIDDKDLTKFNNFYNKRIERVGDLGSGYFNILGKESYFLHPNYEKFINYSFIVLDALELEIAIRNKMKRDRS